MPEYALLNHKPSAIFCLHNSIYRLMEDFNLTIQLCDCLNILSKMLFTTTYTEDFFFTLDLGVYFPVLTLYL